MSLAKIHDIYPTGFTTRHDVGLAYDGANVYLTWVHYDPDTDTDGDLLFTWWLRTANNWKPEWLKPEILAKDAKTGPAMAATLWAWTAAYGDTAGTITVILRDEHAELDRKVLPESTHQRPSITWHGEKLWLAWTGVDGRLNTMYAKTRADFDPKSLVMYDETGGTGPGLAGTDLHLAIAWGGSNDGRDLKVAKVSDGKLTDKVKLSQYDGCGSAPSLSAFDHAFYVGWSGKKDRRIWTVEDPWNPNEVDNDPTTQHAPGLAYPFIAWVDEGFQIQFGQFA